MVITTNGLDRWNKVVLRCVLWLEKPFAESVIHGVSGAQGLGSTIKSVNVVRVTNVAINVWTIVPLNTSPQPTNYPLEKSNENACHVTFCVGDVMDLTHRNVNHVDISKYLK